MKISNTNSLQMDYTNLNVRTKGLSGSYQKIHSEKIFDAISIQSDPRQIAEKTFAASISKQIAAEVRTPVSEDRLDALKNQISSNNYQIDASAIASRILLVREDS